MYSQPVNDPIISRLRPRSVTEILDQAFRLYRKHFLTFLAITAIVFVPVNMGVQLLNVAVQGSNVALQRSALDASPIESAETLNQTVVLMIVLLLVLLGLGVLGGLLQYLSQGALTSAVADSHLDRPVSFGRAYRSMLKHVGPLLGTIGLQILIGIGIFLPTIVVFVLAIAAITAGGDGGVGAGLTFVCLAFLLMFVTFIVYIYVFVRLVVIVPALMVENLGPIQAVRRSWRLVEGYWWRTFGLLLLLGIMGAIISAGPAYLVTAIVTAVTQSFDPVVNTAITGVISVITEAFFIPLSLTCYTLYYFDLRVRKEGFDLETALDQRYSYPGGPGTQAPPPGGYSTGQYPGPGGYPPPQLGYGTQPQNPEYPQQGYSQGYGYPQQGYAPPPGYRATEAPPQGAPTQQWPTGDDVAGPSTGPVEAAGGETPRTEGLGFSTPSIAEQAVQPPGVGTEPQVRDTHAETLETGRLEPPRSGSADPGAGER
jgi:hypothetical protein